MVIQNKLESIHKIRELELNQFPEELFQKGEEEKVLAFLKKYPAEYYAIRDKSSAMGRFFLKVSSCDVLERIKEYTIFTINVSSINYSSSQYLVGEVSFLSNGEVYLTASKNSSYSVRDALRNADYNFKTDIYDKRLKEIPEIDFLYSYLYEHHLIDVIVEFALFHDRVGIYDDHIIIYEIRTSY